MKNIVLFASGSGTNVENIILYFNQNPIAKVVSVFCNNPNAKVIERAMKHHVPVVVFAKEDFKNNLVLDKLNKYQPHLIVLAGFLLQFPTSIIEKYPNQIINIHPALLPKYGGKGMYGMNVHTAVLENKETETGITIHHVNEHYDEGNIIFQQSIKIEDCETPEQIAKRIHELERQHFPIVIEQILNLKS
jgi:phosphoribosylglycinamide formyltransferase 1